MLLGHLTRNPQEVVEISAVHRVGIPGLRYLTLMRFDAASRRWSAAQNFDKPVYVSREAKTSR